MRAGVREAVRCYWAPLGGETGTLVLVASDATVIADEVTLDQACALVAPHVVAIGAPPAREMGADAA